MQAGDANDDDMDNTVDFNILKATFGSTTDLRADFNNNAVVDSPDFNLLKMNAGFGGCGPIR